MEPVLVVVAVAQRWPYDSASLADVSAAGSSPCVGPTYSDDEDDVATMESWAMQVQWPYWSKSAGSPVLSGRKELVAWSRALSAALASQERPDRVQQAGGGEEEVEARRSRPNLQTNVMPGI